MGREKDCNLRHLGVRHHHKGGQGGGHHEHGHGLWGGEHKGGAVGLLQPLGEDKWNRTEHSGISWNFGLENITYPEEKL
jgi:hypothetical protein